MESHPLYGKRKKKFPKCPNPLFEQWLKEWREDAAAKNLKTQYVYGKALKSLQKYPLPLPSGKDCKMLENFGDKMCKMLDDRLQKHIAQYGSATPVANESSDDSDDVIPSCLPRVPQPRSTSRPTNPSNQRVAIDISDSDSDTASSNRQPDLQPKKKRQRSGSSGRGREYIPAYRSGPYAILITLYRNQQTPDSRSYMTKSELISEAQPLADTSFSLADPGSRYTAWSSMGSLIKKGLVIKESSPAKYSLTDAGCELAHKLEVVHAGGSPTVTAGSPRRPGVCSPTTVTRPRVSPASRASSTSVTGSAPGFSASSDFQFTYVTDDDREVTDKGKAAVLIDDDIGVGFLIKCNYIKLLHTGKKYKLDTARPMGTDVYVYLQDIDAPDTCSTSSLPPLPSLTTDLDSENSDKNTCKSGKRETSKNSVQGKPKKSKSTSKSSSSTTNQNATSINPQSSSNDKGSSNRRPHSSLSSLLPSGRPPLLPQISCTDSQSSIDSQPSSQTSSISTMSSARPPLMPRQTSCTDSQSSVDSQPNSQISISSMSSVASLPPPDFVLYPGKFDVVLCVDNQEFYGSRQGGGKSLLPDLIKNGVNCELRKLQVGDLVWVAQERVAPIPGQLEKSKGRELVLDFVIERKRMDDLMRLKQCGLRRPYFMVENYGSMQHFSIPEERIQQTITNLKVIDGFQVKRTKDIKESVAYLTVMTRYIQSHYQNKTLYACSPESLQELGQSFDITDAEFRLQTFEQFSKGSVKTKVCLYFK
ncbi:hypothetical protein FSP39_008762 [Pinctada imbricata]|uniref:Crossover junction endonuclease MUS81 n=1 Tax=Pinctada imbricata TaxID=66713 RepID=A0AA88YAW5_PINIB|nr:hypothetical protein FSP39_008762 [Pinctada imbricata]